MSNLVNLMEQVKKLKNGTGVQSLLDDAYKILGNPILMFNTEYNLLACTEVVTNDPIWNEIFTHGTFSIDTRRFFESEGFIEDVANSAKSALLHSDKLEYDRIAGKIFNKNGSVVSNLVIVACNKPFEEHDQMVFESVCKLISREISQNDFFQEYEQIHQETVIRNMIDGNYDEKLDLAQVGILYDSLESNLYLAVVDISLCDPEFAGIVHLRDLLRKSEPAYKYAIYDNYILAIVSTSDDALNVNKHLKGIIGVMEQYNLYAGLSNVFENLFALRKHYHQALVALQYLMETKSSQRIFPCETSAMAKLEQIEALENGLGIQYFLNKGAEIFGNPLLFHDMEPNLLGCTENVEIIDPIWQELVTYGTGSDETVDLFRTEGWIDIMDNTAGGALLVSDKCKYDRISWRIYNKENIRFGCTSIVNTMKPFSDDELVLFGTFSQKFSKEVKEIELYNDIGQLYSETVINRLISGKIDDYTFYSEDIGNLYDHLMENLYLVVVDMTKCNAGQRNLAYFRDLFNWQGAVNRYAIHGDYIVIIFSFDSLPLDEKQIAEKINEIFVKNNIYAGASSRFDNIYELQKHYNQAVSALISGTTNKELHDSQWFFRFSETSGS